MHGCRSGGSASDQALSPSAICNGYSFNVTNIGCQNVKMSTAAKA